MKLSIVFLFLSIVFLFACTEKTQVNLINGQYLVDCSTPVSFAEIALKANVGNNFGDPIILGSAVTGDNGSFQLSYELEEEDNGNGDLIVVDDQGFETLISGVKLNENHTYTLYRNNISEVIISLTGTKIFSSNDTLFYGLDFDNSEYSIIQPSNGPLDTLYIPVPNLDNSTTLVTLYYGIGKRDFILSREALSISDSIYQHKPKDLVGCSQLETVNIIID